MLEIINEVFYSFKKINLKFVFIAFSHWILSFFTDKFIFQYSKVDISNLIVYKCIFFIILLFLWQIISYLINEYKKNQNIQRLIKYSSIYFVIMMVFLLLTWPGIWRCDEFMILKQAITLTDNYWQGFLISKIYIFFLMLLPFPSGIIIIQNIIISFIVGYIISKFQYCFHDTKLAYFLFIPFLLLPIIDNNLYPMRTTLYAYMWLLLIVKIFFMKYSNKIKTSDLFLISFLVLIISLLRSEGVICVILIPVIFFIWFYKQSNMKQKITVVLLSFFVFITALFVQENIMKKYNGFRYEIYSIVVPMSALYAQADSTLQSEVLLSIENILNLPDFLTGAHIKIHDDIFKKFTKNDYSEFKKAYLKLILNYPFVYFNERYFTFTRSNENIWQTTKLFDKDADYNQFNDIIMLESFQPISIQLRKKIILLIERRDIIDYNIKLKYFDIFYNVVPPLILLVCIILVSLIYKNYVLTFILSFLFFHTLIVFMTAPVFLFIYYFYLYLCSYVLFSMFLIISINNYMRKRYE